MKSLAKISMIKRILNFNLQDWSEVFFPVYNDMKDINEEASTTTIANNNWDLVNEKGEDEYNTIITKIKENRVDEKLNHDVIVL
jgi:hypothetical protein